MFGSWLYCSMYFLHRNHPSRVQQAIECPRYLSESISIYGDFEAHHPVDAVALLRSQVIECFGDHAGIVLKECIRVLLQVLDTLPMLLEGSEFSAGRAAGFLKDRELGAQLVQRDEPFSLLVLIGAALTIYFGKLIRPHLGLSVWVSTRHASLLFYQPLKPCPENIGTLQQVRDETPHFRLQLVGTRLMGVCASLKTVPVAVGASVVVISVYAPPLG
ncbi:MAG: hypothetical protein M3N03_02725 [Actinomycetota bacterium]|nr:hypothetical protein [Actinomycetota bacterium]